MQKTNVSSANILYSLRKPSGKMRVLLMRLPRRSASRFESYTKYRDFNAFHSEQAVGFKNYLAKQDNQQTGKKLSKATLNSTLGQLKAFFSMVGDAIRL
jgi:hypothetical protein